MCVKYSESIKYLIICPDNLDSDLPVDDVISMTVVDTLKNLLHQHSSILLSEFSSSYDFIEELTSLAYSNKVTKN